MRKYKQHIILLLSTIFSSFYCVNAQIDSLNKQIKNCKSEIEKANIYNKISDYYLDLDLKKSRIYADSAKNIGIKHGDFLAIANSFANYANSYLFTGKLDSAFIYFNLSYHAVTFTGNQNEIAAALNRLGLINENMSKYDKAVAYYFKALEIYVNTNYTKGQAEIYNNLGVISDIINQENNALEYYNNSLKLFEKANFLTGQANVYNNLASLYSKQNNPEYTIHYIYKAIKIFVENNQLTEAGTAYANAGAFYNMQDKPDSAKICLDSAFLLFTKNNNIQGLSTVYSEQAKWHLELKQFSKANDLLSKSLELKKQIGNIINEAQTYLEISNYYLQIDDFKNAYLNYVMHVTLRDSILEANSRNLIDEINLKYQSEKKDKQITILKNQANSKKIISRFLLILVITLTLTLLLLFYYFRIKTKLVKSQKELLQNEQEFFKLRQEQEKAKREVLENKLKTEQEFHELHKSKLKAELEHNKRELATTTLQVLNKNKTLSEVVEFINKLKPKTQEEKNNYKEISKLVKANINLDDDWQQVKLLFDRINSDYIKKLKDTFPDLTKSDLKILTYLKIDLSPKEIAQMTNITPDGIYKRLYRIRRKMKLTEYSNLNEFLSKFTES